MNDPQRYNVLGTDNFSGLYLDTCAVGIDRLDELSGSSSTCLPLTHTMRLFGSICVLLWTLLVIVSAKSIAGDRVLVVLEDPTEKDFYSQFWTDLEGE